MLLLLSSFGLGLSACQLADLPIGQLVSMMESLSRTFQEYAMVYAGR